MHPCNIVICTLCTEALISYSNRWNERWTEICNVRDFDDVNYEQIERINAASFLCWYHLSVVVFYLESCHLIVVLYHL